MDRRISRLLDYMMKRLHTRKSLFTSSSTPLPTYIMSLLAATLCCPFIMKNSLSLISSQDVGLEVLLVGMTHSV